MPTLGFNPADHTYSLDGRWVPSVSAILAESGYVKGAAYMTEESRIRGQQAHLAAQLSWQHRPTARSVSDVLEVIEVSETIQPYLAGWLLFLREKKFSPRGWEQPLYLSNPLAAGTLDALGYYGGSTACKAIVDIKTWESCGANPKRAAVIQTAGYRLMAKERLGFEADVRVIVKLPGDGTYRAYEIKEHAQDEFLFKCAAHVYWDRYHNKLIDRIDQQKEVET